MKGFGENNNNNSKKIYISKKDDNAYVKNKLILARNYLNSGRINLAESLYAQLIKEGIISYDLFFSYALLSRNKSNLKLAKYLLNKSISKYPNMVDHYILLAEILKLEKNFPKAMELLLISRKINPRNSNTFYNLALLYRDLDSKKDSLFNINQAIKLDAHNYVYKLLKADILKDENKFEESRGILNELYSNKNINDKKDILLMISSVERLDSNLLEAEKILLKTIRLYPNFNQAYLNLSDLYFEKKLSIKAKEIILEGLKNNSNIPEMHVNLGFIYRSLGEINESKKHFLKALSMNKNLYRCYLSLSTFYDFAENPIELNHLFKVPVKKLNSDDKVRVFFSRGNIYHRREEFKEASKNYKFANDLKSKIYLSNKEQLIEKGNHIKKTFYIDSLEKTINNSRRELIFIVGMPRSGSTLLENILSINEEVVDLGEIEIFSTIMKNYELSNSDNDPYESYIKKLNELHPKAKIATDKNLFNYIYAPVIKKYFKNSKIIFCLRNPLDNILSIYKTNFTKVPFSTNLKDIAEIYIYHYELMKSYSKSYKDILFTYNYDELVIDPDNQIKKIIDWLGWEWSNSYLTPNRNTRSVFTASSEQVRNPVNKNSVGSWKNYRNLLKPAYDLISNHRDLNKYLNA